MFERINACIGLYKISQLVSIFRGRGTFDKDEETALFEISSLYFYGGIRKKEELIKEISNFYDFIYDYSSERESLKLLRRASTRLVSSVGFRERVLDFCLDYLIPFSESKSFFEIRRLYRKFNKNYGG